MGRRVAKRRCLTRLHRYVAYQEDKRRKLRRALALLTAHRLRRATIRWSSWRDQCRRVRRRAKRWRITSLSRALGGWGRVVKIERERVEAETRRFWVRQAKQRAIRYLGICLEDARRCRENLQRAKEHMCRVRLLATLRRWKISKRWFVIERRGDELCTRIQAAWRRRRVLSVVVPWAERRRARHFSKEAISCRKVISIDDGMDSLCRLKKVVSTYEWVFVMVWSSWSPGADTDSPLCRAFSESAVAQCARGYEYREWNEDIRFVRLNGVSRSKVVCRICLEAPASSRTLRRHILRGETEPVEVCRKCWCACENERSSNEAASKRRETDLPDGWEEAFDDASGCTYYYNSLIGESTWDRPVEDIDHAVSETTDRFESAGQIVDSDLISQCAAFLSPPVETFPSFRLYWRGVGWLRRPRSVWSTLCAPLILSNEEVKNARTAFDAERFNIYIRTAKQTLLARVKSESAILLQRRIRGHIGRRRANEVRTKKERRERALESARQEAERKRLELEKLNAPKWVESWEPASADAASMPSARSGRYCWIHRETGEVVYENPYREGEATPRGPSARVKAKTDSSNKCEEDSEAARDPKAYPDAFICSVCSEATTNCKLATWICYECDKLYCSACMAKTHATGKHADHNSGDVHVNAAAGGNMLCVHCDVRTIQRHCGSCSDNFCDQCYLLKHARGRKARHQCTVVTDPPQNPILQREKRSFNPMKRARNAESDADELLRCVEAYVRSIAERHKWMTWRLLNEKELFEENHVRLVEKYREELLAVFNEYDKDASGSIDRNELRDLLVSELCEPVTEADLDDAMGVLDLDGDGAVFFEEFVEWWVVEQIEERSTSLKLGLLRSKLRASKRVREAANVVKAKVRGWQFRRVRAGVRIVDPVRNLNIGGKIAAIRSDGVFDVRCDSGEIVRLVSYKQLRLRKFVGGTYAYRIEAADYENFKDKFARFSRQKYKLDIDMEATSEEKLKESFVRLFVPAWNSGSLDTTFYRDGFEFKLDGDWWQQRWCENKKEFEFRNETTGKVQLENPRAMIRMRSRLRQAFDKYTDVILVDHYVETKTTMERLKSKRKITDISLDPDAKEEEEDVEMVTVRTFTVPLVDDTVYRKRFKAVQVASQFLESFRDRDEKPPPPRSAGLSEKALSKMLREELCEPYQSRQITNAFEELDIYGEGSVEFEPLLRWMARESEKPYRLGATIRTRRLKLQAQKAKRIAGDVAARLNPNDYTKKLVDSAVDRLSKLGVSAEVANLMDMDYGRKDAMEAVRRAPEDPLRWLQDTGVPTRSESKKTKTKSRPRRIKMPAFMRRMMDARKEQKRCKRIKEMNRRREAVREKISAKQERLEGIFGDDNEDEETNLEGKTVFGCVLCDCDEFLADPHNDNKCAACGHEEDEHTIEFELYYDTAETERKQRDKKRMMGRLKRMGLAK
eukprot:g2923.t1